MKAVKKSKKLSPRLLLVQLTNPKQKSFWVALALLFSVIGVILWKKFGKSLTAAATLTAKTKQTGTSNTRLTKALPDYTMLFLDTLEGFSDSEYTQENDVITAPYLEKQVDFAVSAGMDGILIAIPIDHIFKPDGTTDWSVVEYISNYANQKGLFIIHKLRMLPTKTYLFPSLNLGDYAGGSSSIKFSSSFWDTYAKQFAQEYKDNFADWHQDGSILCVMPTSTDQQEWGYNSASALHEGSYGQRIAQTVSRFHELANLLAPLKVGIDSGCYYDSGAANGRGTPAVRELASPSNVVCVKDNPDHTYNIKFDSALGLTTAKDKGGFFMAEHTNSPPGQVTQSVTTGIQTSIDCGVDIVGMAFIYDAAGQAVATEIINGLKSSGHFRRRKVDWNPVGEVTYTTSELQANGGYTGAILNRFEEKLNQNGGKLPRLVPVNTL